MLIIEPTSAWLQDGVHTELDKGLRNDTEVKVEVMRQNVTRLKVQAKLYWSSSKRVTLTCTRVLKKKN